jgi:hypothetical protein
MPVARSLGDANKDKKMTEPMSALPEMKKIRVSAYIKMAQIA